MRLSVQRMTSAASSAQLAASQVERPAIFAAVDLEVWFDPNACGAVCLRHVGDASVVALGQQRLSSEGKHERMGQEHPDGTPHGQGKGDQADNAPDVEGALAALGAKERACDGSCREHRPSTGSKPCEGALLLSQRAGGQFEAELLD